MFEKLFKYKAILDKQKSAPLAIERERYLEHMEKLGCSHPVLIRSARELLWIANRFDGSQNSKIPREQIEKAAEQWARRQYRLGRAKSLKCSYKLFLLEATRWFRFLGWLEEAPALTPAPIVTLLNDLSDFLEHERGLSLKTIGNYCWHSRQFLLWIWPRKQSISLINISDIDDFLLHILSTRKLSRVSAYHCAKGLRALFRHAKMRGWCSISIADAIEAPRLFSQESLPIGPAWGDVQMFLASMLGDREQDIRDRAIGILFAIYGLRSGEVSNLCLEQIDWKLKQIQIWRPKQQKHQTYPLVPVLEEAIKNYIAKVRPKYSGKEIFLTMKAPIGPISGGGLYDLVRKRLEKLGIQSRKKGPHALRHSCASHLVVQGLSLTEIGDHLGHRSVTSTRIYAKVDLPHLHEVAAFDCGSLL